MEIEFLDERPMVVCDSCGADKEREACHEDCPYRQGVTPAHTHGPWVPAHPDWHPIGTERCDSCGMTRRLLSGFRITDNRRRIEDQLAEQLVRDVTNKENDPHE